jgi:hypothetical protein
MIARAPGYYRYVSVLVIAGRETNTAAVTVTTSTMAKTATAMTIGAATTVLGENVAMKGTVWAAIVSFFVWFRSIDRSIAVENGGSWRLVAGIPVELSKMSTKLSTVDNWVDNGHFRGHF